MSEELQQSVLETWPTETKSILVLSPFLQFSALLSDKESDVVGYKDRLPVVGGTTLHDGLLMSHQSFNCKSIVGMRVGIL